MNLLESRPYNRGANIINAHDVILGVTAKGLSITAVGLLTKIVAAPAMIGIESVAIIIGLVKF